MLDKDMNNSSHQASLQGGGKHDGRVCPASPVDDSEFTSLNGFAVDEEGTIEFRWFPSLEILVAQLEVWLREKSFSDTHAPSPHALMHLVRSCSETTYSGEQIEAQIESLLAESYPAFPLAWVGRFTTLCTSNGAFPEEVRLRFWMTNSDEYLTSIITPHLYLTFAKFLSTLSEG